ncbi:MAG: SDR family oxidoreductase [Pseudomonadota bacterium]|nr:SDR family oxidoreductase [Pseudomonadota bacterium]
MSPSPATHPQALQLSLVGRVVLVSGAASGIGRAIALACGHAGASVAVNHLGRAAEAHAVAAQLDADGARSFVVEADVRRADEVASMVGAVERSLGPIDSLVNNAGVIQDKPFLDTTEADWDHVLDTDLKSVFLMCKAVLPGMVARGSGVIVNIASDLGILGRAQFAPYCTAKAGVIGLTRSLAREFAPAIRVNAIAPGPVATAMLSAEHMSPEWIEKELDIPQHRFADPAEIAATALFLLSDLSRFYCGQVLGPNGGSVMP